ncbi:hypothetical protein [Desulfosporosinus hippei]|uniref:Uncharacterized protein n=1 Tax=Desulfosporosinus hippei DSM 8344 TaxID=1121419 RepID=A0A1G8CHP0_9FIRM|nr:hypothetical protein [Desulfosporosinus hippei]SDH44440.1 hypothetical protein SAMN05443529_11392 [Desulfosporosinus hippei DSM 8344]
MINQQQVNDWLDDLIRKVLSGEAKEFSILKDRESFLFCEKPDFRRKVVYRSYITLHVSDVINLQATVTRPECIKASLGNGEVISNLSEKNFVIGCFRRYLIQEIRESDIASPELIKAIEIGFKEVYTRFKGNVLKEQTTLIKPIRELPPNLWFKELFNTTESKSFYVYWTGTRFAYCLKKQLQLPLILEITSNGKIAQFKLIRQILEEIGKNKYSTNSEVIKLQESAVSN